MLLSYALNRFEKVLTLSKTIEELYDEVKNDESLKKLASSYAYVNSTGYDKEQSNHFKAMSPYFFTHEGTGRAAESIKKVKPVVVLDLDKIEPENVNLVASTLRSLKPNLMYKTASGLAFRVVFVLDFKILVSDLDILFKNIAIQLNVLKIGKYLDLGSKALGKAWGLWHDEDAIYNADVSPFVEKLRNSMYQKELLEVLSITQANLMKIGVEGNRHRYRYNTALLLGGLCAEHNIPHGLALDLFIAQSDALSDDGKTSASELETIRSGFEAGLERPVCFANKAAINGIEESKIMRDFNPIYVDIIPRLSDKGKLVPCQQNTTYELSRVAVTGMKFYLDTHSNTVYCNGEPVNFTNLCQYDKFLSNAPKSQKEVPLAIRTIAGYNTFSSAVDFFDGLEWDGVERVAKLYEKMPVFTDFENSIAYYEKVFEFMLLGIILRSYKPGHKFDYGFFLVGAKGVGKTRFIQSINPEYENSKPFVPTSWLELSRTNDAKAANLGAHILYIEENVGMDKLGVGNIKGILSRQVESGRKMYSDITEDLKRTAIIVADSNEVKFIKESSTNRKILPVILTKQVENYINQVRIDCDYIKANIDQLYAEVKAKHIDTTISGALTDNYSYYADFAIEMESLSTSAIDYCTQDSPFIFGFMNTVKALKITNIHFDFIVYYVNNTRGLFYRHHSEAIHDIYEYLKRDARYHESDEVVMSNKAISFQGGSLTALQFGQYTTYSDYKRTKPGFIYSE